MITSKMILDCIADGVFTIDAGGLILSFNKAAESITGFSEAEVRGKPCMSIFRTELCHSLCPLKVSMKTEDAVSNFEIVITHHNGKRIPISVNTAVLKDSSGRILGGVETFRDISEVKTLRDHLERIARLRSLAIIAAGVAHEIRNPLACIRTNLEHMREDLSPDFRHSEILDDAIIEVSRADEIIKRLIDFATPERPRKVNIDVNELIASVLGYLAVQCRRFKIRIDRRLTPDLPGIQGDSDQLRTALLNIMLNSLEAMPSGGTLLVETAGDSKALSRKGIHVSPPETAADWQFVRVVIQDSGVGIPKEQLAHVFEPFFSSKSDGIGLGLAVSHQVIEQHAGILDIESEPGAGTIVSIRLPVFAADTL